MIKVEKREQIRRAYYVEGKSIRKIAKEQRCSRDTVRQAIESAEPKGYTLKEPRPAPVLGPYKDRINELLAESESLNGSFSDKKVTWRDGFSLEKLGNKPVKIQFEFKDTTIYSFSFAE